MAQAPYVLNGKVALVTGGARGIGFATAQLLARRGASVVVVDLDGGAARNAASQIGDAAVGIGADVTDRAAMQRAVATTVERFGGLDVVMANAGLASRAATMRAMSASTSAGTKSSRRRNEGVRDSPPRVRPAGRPEPHRAAASSPSGRRRPSARARDRRHRT